MSLPTVSCQDHFPRTRRRGVVLNEKIAGEIYSRKPFSGPSKNSTSVLVSRQYNISPKTVRDIWNRKTWSHATSNLFPCCKVRKFTPRHRSFSLAPQMRRSAILFHDCGFATFMPATLSFSDPPFLYCWIFFRKRILQLHSNMGKDGSIYPSLSVPVT